MMNQYPKHMSTTEYAFQSEGRLLPEQYTFRSPMEAVIQLEPGNNIDAVRMFGSINDVRRETEGIWLAEIILLRDDWEDDIVTPAIIEDGFWEVPEGHKPLEIEIGDETIPVLDGYMTEPDENDLHMFMDVRDDNASADQEACYALSCEDPQRPPYSRRYRRACQG